MSASAKPKKFYFNPYPKRFEVERVVEYNYTNEYHEGTKERAPEMSDLSFYVRLHKSRVRVDGECASWDPR